jgi:hypothetical protein
MEILKTYAKQPSTILGVLLLSAVWVIGVENIEAILKASTPILDRVDKLLGTVLGVMAILYNEKRASGKADPE